MLKPVSPNSHLLYHTFLLGLKKKKNHPLPVPCQSCWGDPALGPKEGTLSSWGFVLVCHLCTLPATSPHGWPRWPCWPQQPHLCTSWGGMWSAGLTTALLPLQIWNSKRNLRLRMPVQSLSWEKPLNQMQSHRKPFSAFSPWEKKPGG